MSCPPTDDLLRCLAHEVMKRLLVLPEPQAALSQFCGYIGWEIADVQEQAALLRERENPNTTGAN